jgi:hypothetical protein
VPFWSRHPCARGRAKRARRYSETPLPLIALFFRQACRPLPKQHLVRIAANRGERRCISQVAVCLNPSEFGTTLPIRTWRCALAPASGPPKDGQPPPDFHSGCRACQRLSEQQKWRLRTAQRSQRETQTWPLSQLRELPLQLLAGATNCSWRTCTARSGVRQLTFDMRGAQKAQPFGHPLDGRVRPVSPIAVLDRSTSRRSGGCIAQMRLWFPPLFESLC